MHSTELNICSCASSSYMFCCARKRRNLLWRRWRSN